MLVVRYEKLDVFAKSCWSGIPNSCNDLFNIERILQKYGSLKPQLVISNRLVAKYAECHFECDLNDNVPSLW